jgi:hypothetical protein
MGLANIFLLLLFLTVTHSTSPTFHFQAKQMASVLTKSAITRGRDEVYVMAMPLRATKGPAQLFMSTAYSLNLWDLQHFMVLIKPSSPPPSSQVLSPPILPTWVFSFSFC